MRAVMLLLMVTVAGCTGTSRPTPPSVPFRIEAPRSLEVLNGLTVKQDLPIEWTPAEREDLEISATIEPDGKGVSALVETRRLERGAGPIQLLVRATEIAEAGDYTLTLTAKGAKSGQVARGTVAVKVPRKE